MAANWLNTLTQLASRPGTRRGLAGLGAMLPLVSLVPGLLEEEQAAGKGKGKRRRKRRRTCATAGTIPNKGRRKRCCQGLVTDASGRCAAPVPVGCTGLKPAQTSPTQGLQEAIDQATAGDTLSLCAGTWNLTSTVEIGKDLTLIGAGALQTVLDGGDAIRVLLVQAGAQVTLRDLTITEGNVFDRGGGIQNRGTLTLREASVTSNTVVIDGGGIFNEGTLTLGEGTSVSGNTAGGGGGGIFNLDATLVLQAGSSVSGNNSQFSGGGIRSDRGVVTMQSRASVSVNTARGSGGGITNKEGTLTLQTGASVTGNTAGDAGGGIHNSDNGTLTLEEGSSVTGNTSVNQGGGILHDSGTVTLEGPDPSPIVVNNCQDNCGGPVVVDKCAPPPVSCS